jgi:hypothetical protein
MPPMLTRMPKDQKLTRYGQKRYPGASSIVTGDFPYGVNGLPVV